MAALLEAFQKQKIPAQKEMVSAAGGRQEIREFVTLVGGGLTAGATSGSQLLW